MVTKVIKHVTLQTGHDHDLSDLPTDRSLSSAPADIISCAGSS